MFCMESPLVSEDGTAVGAEAWWRAHRRAVASLLTQEPDVDHLSKQEAEESTGRFLSYYEHDLVVVDWDAALIIDERQNFDETLYVMELANLQLAELEAYDRILDDALERAYRDLSARPTRGRAGMSCANCGKSALTWRGSATSCPTSPSSSGTGTWRASMRTSRRASTWRDWHRTIDKKLQTLDDLYQLLNHDQTNRWMLILEVTIVLLFVIDLVILVLGLKGH